ncbi:unnamed protein product [Blepharisma stoltei]|uniref:non-specific serine/threonine protein kinase n=1 Tax=Blepharisma stoltei TaxID=1481888 RepID=A0AAU9JQ80_9CILI|nr:unnamed protein product [Blepharisma stoltei]
MASPRPNTHRTPDQRDPISSNTRDKAQAAKDYIEKKYSRLKKTEESRKEEWQELNVKMAELKLSNTEQNLIRQEIMHKEAEQLRMGRQKITIYDFEPISVIGKGAFGEVRVVRNKNTGEILAMKKMNKSEMVYKNQIQHIRAERDALASSNNPWIVSLKNSFQDEKYLYLVMEYLPGGDLMNLLIKKNVLTEPEARFYIAETILAVDSVHKINYIHRDLKPDNILLDSRGHVKLSDFGLSKHVELSGENVQKLEDDDLYIEKLGKRAEARRNRKLAYSTVGTPDYIAPEVFSKEGYCEAVDWWSVGVILFEMLAGYPPFFADKPADTCHKILAWKKHFSIPREARISPIASDLIRKLICQPEDRLGNRGVEEIKSHPFFNGVNWENIRNLEAPNVPELSSEIDTSNFDKIEENEPFYPPESSRKKKQRKDANFIGYTYKRDIENQRNGLVTALVELDAIKKTTQRQVLKSPSNGREVLKSPSNTREVLKSPTNILRSPVNARIMKK